MVLAVGEGVVVGEEGGVHGGTLGLEAEGAGFVGLCQNGLYCRVVLCHQQQGPYSVCVCVCVCVCV